jgi:non-ribosomal peptide synthetase component F
MSNLLQELVTQQAEKQPDACAVIANNVSTRYQDLEAQANQLARVLREHGCRRGDRVSVFAPRSLAAVVAMLAINKADAIYVPLGSIESAQVQAAAAACQPTLMLVTMACAATVSALFEAGAVSPSTLVGSLESAPIATAAFGTGFSMADAASAPSRPIASRNRAANPAYVMYSFKNGGMRGVVGTHAATSRFVRWANGYFGVEPGARLPWQASLADDWSMYEILGPLAAGAVVYPSAGESDLSPHRVADAMRRLEFTHWWTSPATMTSLAEADVVAPAGFPALRRVAWTGRGVPAETLTYWMTRLSHVQFTAMYGFSEATIASAYYTFPREIGGPAAPFPVGTPCPGEEVLVVNESLGSVGADEVGEICIRGLGLGPGYWRDPAGTEAVFPRNPSDPMDRLFRTGDLGRLGRDGRIYVVGHVSDRVAV